MPARKITQPVVLFVMFLALCHAGLAAQAAEGSWTIRVAAFNISGEHHTLWLRTGPGKEAVEVSLNTRTFSPPIQYKGPEKLAFYRNAGEATAEEPPPPLASVAIKSKSSLLLFFPQQDKEGYQAFAIADDDFPFHSFRFVNLSQSIVRAELDGKSAVLKPGAAETFAYREAPGPLPVRIHGVNKGEKPRLLRQSTWSIIPTRRELVIFFPNPQNGLVRARHFVDSTAEAPSVDRN